MGQNSDNRYTLAFAKYALKNHYPKFTEETKTVLTSALLDSFSCMIRGSNENCVVKLIDVWKDQAANGPCSVVGHPEVAFPPAIAACINGTAIHSQDFDDNHIDFMIHQESVTVPVALALTQMQHLSVQELLNAIYVGMQVTSAIDQGVRPEHYWAGWHCTSTEGVFGAVAGAGYLLSLTEDQLCNAFGIAAAACGGHQKNFGTDSKPYQVGLASFSAIQAVVLAKAGYTGCPNIFDTDFWDSYSPRVDRDTMVSALTDQVACLGLRFKNYPCGIPTHSGAINGMYYRNECHLTTNDIDSIELETPAVGARITKSTHPKTGLAGKFSIPFTFACGFVFGEVTDKSFTDEIVNDPRIVAVLDKFTSIRPNDNLTPSTGGTAIVKLKNGQTLTHTVHMLSRNVTPAYQYDQAKSKFLRLTPEIIGAEKANGVAALFDMLREDQTVQDILDAF